jgi:tetratricopeptide (TPR) repeat protein
MIIRCRVIRSAQSSKQQSKSKVEAAFQPLCGNITRLKAPSTFVSNMDDSFALRRDVADSNGGSWLLSFTVSVALIALTWFVFGQTTNFGFVNYDDPEWVSENPNVNAGLTRNGIVWAFARVHAGPLASISHMLDFQVYGARPGGHHLTNVLLHAGAAVLFFLVLRRMTGGPWRSAVVAALFAIHPLRVESVAWVTERKDVLSGIFFALTLAAYLFYLRRPSAGRYLTVAGCFVLGLLSKSMLMTMPLILLLLDYWPLGRFHSAARPLEVSRRLILEKLPLVFLSIICAAATFLTHAQSVGSVQQVPFAARLGNALVSFVIYIRQMFYPNGLSVFYGFLERSLFEVIAALVLLIGVSITVIIFRKRYPYLFTGWFWYLVMIAPVSGLLQIGLQSHADRYTYLPHIGLYIMLIWGVADLSRRWVFRRQILAVAALVVIGSFTWVARGVAAYWRDSESLWTRAIEVTPENDFAHANLADLLLREGRTGDAIEHAQAALRINPGNADAHNNLALAISRSGRLAEAIGHWQKSLELHSGNLNARCNLAWVLATAPNSSLRDGPRAVELVEPVAAGSGGANAVVLQTLAAAYAQSGRFTEAISSAQKALQLASAQGNNGLADYIRVSLANYEANRPWVDETLVDAVTPPRALARPD